MQENSTIETELGYFQRYSLIEKLVRRFAKITGWEIEENTDIFNSKNPRIHLLITMAEAAIEEVENEINVYEEEIES
ncbi:hypothetical protein [Dendronalium sp. ChiSLP03b]|uniref:hypothetical protein n=1 Tax=Dendronalium sp. ChiSLP03b TaxID=3075381 RepID=UPI0039188794